MYHIDFTEKPGETWNYQSGNTQLMGIILARATEKALANMRRKTLDSDASNRWCKMDDRWHKWHRKSFCCLNSNALDYARFGQLFIDKGNWKGQQLIDSAYVEASQVLI